MKPTLLPLLVLAVPAAAGPLPVSYIPADAQWVVHVDVEQGLRSTVGSYITAHLGEFEFDGLEAVRAKTGINPFADIKDLTVFGSSADPEEGVAIIHATAAVDAFLERARAEESSFQRVEHAGRTLDTWTEHSTKRFGFVRSLSENDRLILVAQDADRLVAAIDRTEAAAPRAEPGDLLRQPPKPASVLFVAARGLGSMGANPKTVMLQQAEALVIDCGEEDGFLYANMAVTTRGVQDAQDLLAAMNGCIAVARMGARRNPELAGLLDATSGLSLSVDSSTVRGQIRYESARAIDMLKEAAARRHPKAAPEEGKEKKPDTDRAPAQPAPAPKAAPQKP